GRIRQTVDRLFDSFHPESLSAYRGLHPRRLSINSGMVDRTSLLRLGICSQLQHGRAIATAVVDKRGDLWSLIAEDDDLRDGKSLGVRDSQKRRWAVDRAQSLGRPAVELQLRGAGSAHHFEMTPQHAIRMSGTQRFHSGFFRSEAGSEIDCRHAVTPAIRDLIVGEDAAHKTLAVAVDRGGDTLDVGRVDSNPDDVRHA